MVGQALWEMIGQALREMATQRSGGARFVALASQRVVELLARAAPDLRFEAPLGGLALGQRLRWYDERLQVRSGSDGALGVGITTGCLPFIRLILWKELSDGVCDSIINLKGGVGKTTITLALAHFLALEHGKRVLVIDLDPQTNATVCLIPE